MHCAKLLIWSHNVKLMVTGKPGVVQTTDLRNFWRGIPCPRHQHSETKLGNSATGKTSWLSHVNAVISALRKRIWTP